MKMKVTELKADYPLSKKAAELMDMIDKKESKENESSESYLFYSPEQEKILQKKENKSKILAEIDKAIANFIEVRQEAQRKSYEENKTPKEMQYIFNRERMDEILAYYQSVIQDYRKEIEKLAEERNKLLKKYVTEALKNYTSPSNEKTILVIPDFDQNIEDEYDMSIFIHSNVFKKNPELKQKFINTRFEYDLKISQLELTLSQYIKDNKEIEEFEYLLKLKKDFKSNPIFGTNRYIKILKQIEEGEERIDLFDDIFSLDDEDDEDIVLAKKYNENPKKTEEIYKENLEKELLGKDEFYKEYFYTEWFMIETYDESWTEKELKDSFLPKKAVNKLKENTDLKYSIFGNQIVIRKEFRKDYGTIGEALIEYLKKIKFYNKNINIAISHFIYDESDPENVIKTHEYIDIQVI